MPKTVGTLRRASLRLDRFDGGLNIREAPSELAANESPKAMNVTINERGGVQCRLGLSDLGGIGLSADVTYLYYSTVADALLAYVSTDGGNGKLYKSTDGGVNWSSVFTTFTAGAKAAIIDFAGANGGRVVVVNTLDGVYSFPSSLAAPTRTVGGAANMDEVRGSAIAVWQNKLWVVGDPREDATHSKARVWWSNAGNEQLWTVATAFIDIRDVDTAACTAIGAGQGMDVTGKPTLLVFKERSTYRINDSTSGAYTTLHSNGAGAASSRAVASTLGRICSINTEGVWVTDGLGIPVRVSDKLAPLFTPDGLDFSSVADWSAGPNRDRVVFAVRRAGGSTNDLMIEYHPTLGWFVTHTFRRQKTLPDDALTPIGVGPMAVYTKNTTKLIGMTSQGGTYNEASELFRSGVDGTALGQTRNIRSRYQTPWVPVATQDEGRLRSLRVQGRGEVTVTVLTDFADVGDEYALDFTGGTGFVWGTGLWDVGSWGEPNIESHVDVPLDQVCKYVSLVFSASTTTSAAGAALLGDGTAPEVGAWAVYGANLDLIPLGT